MRYSLAALCLCFGLNTQAGQEAPVTTEPVIVVQGEYFPVFTVRTVQVVKVVPVVKTVQILEPYEVVVKVRQPNLLDRLFAKKVYGILQD